MNSDKKENKNTANGGGDFTAPTTPTSPVVNSSTPTLLTPPPLPPLPPVQRKVKSKYITPLLIIFIIAALLMSIAFVAANINHIAGYFTQSSKIWGNLFGTQNPRRGYNDSSNNTPSSQSLYEALNMKRIWYVVSTSSMDEDDDSLGTQTIYKNDIIINVLETDGNGNVTVYNTYSKTSESANSNVLKTGDLKGLSDEVIIKKAKKLDRKYYDEGRDLVIKKIEYDKQNYEECKSNGDELLADGTCWWGGDIFPDYDFDSNLANAKNASYRLPKKESLKVSIRVDGTGNSTEDESFSYSSYSWQDMRYDIPGCNNNNCFYKIDNKLDLKAPISATVYDKTLYGFIADNYTALVSTYESSFTGLSFDTPQTKGIKTEED